MASASALAQCPPLDRVPAPAQTPAGPAVTCRADATLTRLFTPRAVPGHPYDAYVTDAALDTVAGRFRARAGQASRAERSWVVEEMDPLAAFGDAGLYNETKVARLYTGRRARVARGPVIENGVTVASITLISPYPDPSLTRLQAGTLIIEFRIPRELRDPEVRSPES